MFLFCIVQRIYPAWKTITHRPMHVLTNFYRSIWNLGYSLLILLLFSNFYRQFFPVVSSYFNCLKRNTKNGVISNYRPTFSNRSITTLSFIVTRKPDLFLGWANEASNILLLRYSKKFFCLCVCDGDNNLTLGSIYNFGHRLFGVKSWLSLLMGKIA